MTTSVDGDRSANSTNAATSVDGDGSADAALDADISVDGDRSVNGTDISVDADSSVNGGSSSNAEDSMNGGSSSNAEDSVNMNVMDLVVISDDGSSVNGGRVNYSVNRGSSTVAKFVDDLSTSTDSSVSHG